MDDNSRHSIQDYAVLQMVREDMLQLRESIASHQRYTQEEFRRLHDRLEELQREVRNELTSHDRDITKLSAQASLAGRAAGFIAGALSGLLTATIIAVAKYFLLGN